MMHEWPLIIFTTLIQISIGCYLLTMCYAITTKDTSRIIIPVIASLAIGMFGLFASVFHLGNPWHMYNTMNNIFSSWMSREVLFVGAYVGLLSFNVLIFLMKQKHVPLLHGVTTFIGISTIFVMSNIYINSLFVLWSGWNTYSAFWATPLITGSLIALLVFTFVLKRQNQYPVMQKVMKLFLVFACIAFLLNVFNYIYIQENIGINATRAITARYANGELVMMLLSFKLALLFSVLAMMVFIKNRLKSRISFTVILFSSVLAVTAELIGRYSYFMLSA